MKPHVRSACRPWRRAVLALWSTCAAPVWAQGVPDATSETLRAELSMVRYLCSPNRPIWLRLALHSTSSEPVEIPLTNAPPADAGIGLPAEIVFGTAGEPALFVKYQDDKPVPVPSTAPREGPEPQKGVLRLSPHGSVGREVDLRECLPSVRYTGTYRVEWRPLGGRAGTGVTEFRVEARKDAILTLDKPGQITFALMYEEAPRNVENFLDLVREGFYDGKTIHRIIPGFLIQGGSPTGDGGGIRPDGKLLPAEFHDAPIQLGTLVMARKQSDPNSASCQFFVALGRLPELDGRYTVIGQASDEESLRTLNQIAAEPTDDKDRPRRPLVIRSISLVDAEQSGTTRLEIAPRTSTAPAVPATPPEAKSQVP